MKLSSPRSGCPEASRTRSRSDRARRPAPRSGRGRRRRGDRRGARSGRWHRARRVRPPAPPLHRCPPAAPTSGAPVGQRGRPLRPDRPSGAEPPRRAPPSVADRGSSPHGRRWVRRRGPRRAGDPVRSHRAGRIASRKGSYRNRGAVSSSTGRHLSKVVDHWPHVSPLPRGSRFKWSSTSNPWSPWSSDAERTTPPHVLLAPNSTASSLGGPWSGGPDAEPARDRLDPRSSDTWRSPLPSHSPHPLQGKQNSQLR